MSDKSTEVLREEMIAAYISVLVELYMKKNSLSLARKMIEDCSDPDFLSKNLIRIGLNLEIKGKPFEFVRDIITNDEFRKNTEFVLEKLKQMSSLN